MSELDRLRDTQFNDYLVRRIPDALDDVVGSMVTAYRSRSGEARTEMNRELDPGTAGILCIYGERMAAIAVRSRSTGPLLDGLVAMGMADDALADNRANLLPLAAVNHSATVIGSSLSALLDEVGGDLPERALANFRAFVSRSERDKSLQAMGLGTAGSDDSFRYVST